RSPTMADLRRRVPIEQLSEARWQRIEESLFDRLDQEAAKANATPQAPPRVGRSWAIALAAAVVLLGVIGVSIRFGSVGGDRGEISDRVASIAAQRVISHGGTSEFSAGDATIRLEAHGRATVLGDDVAGWLILLDEGIAHFEVPPRADRPSFEVRAGEV